MLLRLQLVIVVVVGQTVGSISSKTLAYDCLCSPVWMQENAVLRLFVHPCLDATKRCPTTVCAPLFGCNKTLAYDCLRIPVWLIRFVQYKLHILSVIVYIDVLINFYEFTINMPLQSKRLQIIYLVVDNHLGIDLAQYTARAT